MTVRPRELHDADDPRADARYLAACDDVAGTVYCDDVGEVGAGWRRKSEPPPLASRGALELRDSEGAELAARDGGVLETPCDEHVASSIDGGRQPVVVGRPEVARHATEAGPPAFVTVRPRQPRDQEGNTVGVDDGAGHDRVVVERDERVDLGRLIPRGSVDAMPPAIVSVASVEFGDSIGHVEPGKTDRNGSKDIALLVRGHSGRRGSDGDWPCACPRTRRHQKRQADRWDLHLAHFAWPVAHLACCP